VKSGDLLGQMNVNKREANSTVPNVYCAEILTKILVIGHVQLTTLASSLWSTFWCTL